MGRKVVLTNRAQDQSGSCFINEPANRQNQKNREIYKGAMAKNHPPKTVIGKRFGKGRVDRVDCDTDIVRTDQRRKPNAKNRKRQSGCNLISTKRQNQDSKDRRSCRAREHSNKNSKPRISRLKCHGKTSDGADQHHALDAQINNPTFLNDQFPRGRQ